MANRYSRKKKKTNTGTILAAVTLGMLSVGMLAAFGWLWLKSGDDVIVRGTNCPVAGPTSATVVLFDATDRISPATLEDLKNQVRSVVENIEKGGYLSVVNLTGTPGVIQTMFEGCNPGDGSSVDSWTNSPQLRQQKWERYFDKPLENITDKVGKGTGADRSPIMAAIQKVKLTVFDSEIGSGIPNMLYVASDMIEHTDLYSQYKSGPDYGKYASSEAAKDYRTHLEGVDVTLFYIERPNRNFDAIAHAEFWQQWVERQDGNFVRVVRLVGMNR